MYSQPLDTFPPKNKSFSTKLFQASLMERKNESIEKKLGLG